MENIVTLKATNKGLIGDYVKYASWALICIVNAVVIFFAFAFPIWTKAEEKYSTRPSFYKNAFDVISQDYYSYDPLCFVLICMASSILFVSFIICICCIIGHLYKAKEVNVFDKNKKTVTATQYGFPYQKGVSEMKFDRITSIYVEQGTFDRLFNTGSILINVLTYANADSIENSWTIEYIEDPFTAKEQILAGLPEYSGVKVVLENN